MSAALALVLVVTPEAYGARNVVGTESGPRRFVELTRSTTAVLKILQRHAGCHENEDFGGSRFSSGSRAMSLSSRLVKEYRELRGAKRDPEIDLNLIDEADIFVWTAVLQGPTGTPYEGGSFKLLIKCPPNYPLIPPKVTFVTNIFHPNVLYNTGEICLDILKPDAWTPAWTLQSVCRAVAALLSHPEADSPLNCDCGEIIPSPSRSCPPSPLLPPAHAPPPIKASSSSSSHDDGPTKIPAGHCCRQPHPQWRHARLPLDGTDVHCSACQTHAGRLILQGCMRDRSPLNTIMELWLL
jgi:peroxin-4